MNKIDEMKAMMVKFAEGQSVLQANLEKALSEFDEEIPHISAGTFIGAVGNHPEKVNWKLFMDMIEHFGNGSEDESYVAYMYLCFAISNWISMGKLDPKYIDGLAGPSTIKFMRDFDRFHGSKTPGFY